jgi:hypothetical protein
MHDQIDGDNRRYRHQRCFHPEAPSGVHWKSAFSGVPGFMEAISRS